jgi:hypothetical protein
MYRSDEHHSLIDMLAMFHTEEPDAAPDYLLDLAYTLCQLDEDLAQLL